MERSFLDREMILSRVLLACYLRPGVATEPNHPNRPCWGLAYHTSSGTEYYYSDGTVLHAEPGSLVFLPKGESYSVRKLSPGACYAINFELASPVPPVPERIRIHGQEELERLFQKAVQIWTRRPDGYTYRLLSVLYEILSFLQNDTVLPYSETSRFSRIAPAVDYLRQCRTERMVSISELAAMSDMSEAYFRRIFHARFSMSPVQYRQQLQLERAKELLCSSDCTIAAAAELSGFCDTSYFCRVFRHTEGIAPGTYRSRVKNPSVPGDSDF